MKFSVITATIDRPSLARCIESVDTQNYPNREHIVIHDNPPSGDFGNSARHKGWEFASGDYVIYLDDDNFFSHTGALSEIASALESRPEWALFPILRYGSRFFSDTPGCCHTDTANMVIKREIAQWPEGGEYTMDGIFADRLKLAYPWKSFPHVAPIITVPVQGKGEK